MKKCFIAIITFSVILVLVQLCAGAEIVESGNCGNGIFWSLDDKGLLTISGKGEMINHPWVNNNDKDERIKRVIIYHIVSFS